MARFIGTSDEFYRILEPIIRKDIQNRTRPIRHIQDACPDCCKSNKRRYPGSPDGVALETAHPARESMRTIIHDAIAPYETSEGVMDCRIEDVRASIVQRHAALITARPARIMFMCRPCANEWGKR